MSTFSQSYPMSGGEDLHSYIHNSSYQVCDVYMNYLLIYYTKAKIKGFIIPRLNHIYRSCNYRQRNVQISCTHIFLIQKAAIDSLQEKTRLYILEKIDLLSLKTGLSTFTIADFGCSVGPNTFHAVQNIIDAVKLTNT